MLLSSWFRPLGDKISSFNIQKFPLSFKLSFKAVSLTFPVSISFSIKVKVNFGCWIKLFPFALK